MFKQLVQLSKIEPHLYQELLCYREEFMKNGEVIHGGAGLERYSNIASWHQQCKLNEHEDTVEPGYVPAEVWCLVTVDPQPRVIGLYNLRFALNDYLYHYGGHIGYSITPEERGKGYATQGLELLKQRAQQLKMEKLLLTCDDQNIASCKVIERNGGLLENIVLEGERRTKRYWITLV